ncbi:MAG TPA: hypothetical protein VF720_00510 [Candidatus Eisenbacteria bacterium]
MRFANTARAVLVGSLVTLSAGVASAAHLTIIDTASDVTVQPDGNFEFGFNSVQNNQHDWSFSGSWIADSGSTGEGVIYFVDPNTNELEDIYTLSWTYDGFFAATLSGRFESDNGGVIASGRTIPAGFPTVDVTNGNVDVLGLFRDPTTGAPVSVPSNITMLVNFDYAPVATEASSWSAIKGKLAR